MTGRLASVGPATVLEDLEAAIFQNVHCIGAWDCDPSRVTLGTDLSFADRTPAGNASVEHASHSTLSLVTTGLPKSGQIRQAIRFDGTGLITVGQSTPAGATDRFSKLVIFRSDKGNATGVAAQSEIWRGTSGASNTHRFYINGATVSTRIGGTGDLQEVSDRHPFDAWTWGLASYDNNARLTRIALRGVTPTSSAATTSQKSNNTANYIGGTVGTPSFLGWIYHWSLFDIDLLDSNHDFLAIVNRYCAYLVGARNADD
jgi:hypothetical protein